MVVSIITGVVGILLLVGWVFLAVVAAENRQASLSQGLRARWFMPVVALALFVLLSSVVQINAGEVGVIRRFGAVLDGQLEPGLHVKLPIADKVITYNTKQMVYELSDNPDKSQANYTDYSVHTMTEDGQRIIMRFSVVFSVDGKMAGQIANTIGTESDVVEKIIKSNARSEGRNVPKGFSAKELYSEDVYSAQTALFQKLEPIYAKNGVILHELLLRDIGFDEDLAAALERKQIALEDAVTAERNIKIKEQEAQQQVAKAQGEKQAAIIAAEGQARAIKLVQDQLARSGEYTDYIFKKGIADGTSNVKVIISDGKTKPLIDMREAK